MRSSLVMSLIGVATMAAALLVGCGDDDAKPVSSKQGQSCVRTADCAEGLSCIANVCYKTAPVAPVGQAGETSSPIVGPVLGGEGESCTSRRDCNEGLGCFNNRCTETAAPMGDGGAPSTSPGIQLGAKGETCRVNGDCTKGLVCVPSSSVAGIGVCDVADFNITPTNSTCGGECLADSDCYQLPVALQTAAIKSCEDIADAITQNEYDCAAPVAAAKALCFQQATYCGYTSKSRVWSCDTDSHSCVYNKACVVAAGFDVPTGCPSVSRIRPLTTLTCNPDTLKCVGASAAVACTTDAKCEGKQVADSAVTDLCTAGECTCYAGNKQCYRKCARNIDCGTGKSCDTKLKLCVPSGSCDNDAQCAVTHQSLAFVCHEGTCAESCSSDRECSGTGRGDQESTGFTAFNGRVCGMDGFCASVSTDCTENTNCELPSGLKTFCVPKPDVSGTTVSSAVTD